VTYIGHADLKGSLPGWVTAQIYAKQPMTLAAVRPMIEALAKLGDRAPDMTHNANDNDDAADG
jgi:hypothetical protein